MELKRKILKDLLAWKNREKHLPLILKGPRQVGKTYIIEKFCKENYENFIEINFSEDKRYKNIFENSLKIDEITEKIRYYFPNSRFVENKTIIFLDEIQLGGNARTALKFFANDKRYDVICSGSMLGLYHQDVDLFPVGFVEILEMHGLDFEEFLIANGVAENMIDNLHDLFVNIKPVDIVINDKLLELFKKYIVVGGMPQVVTTYLENKDVISIRNTKKNIIMEYMNDVTKYAKNTDKEKILECFDSIPAQLAKDYKKFRYSLVEKKGTSTKFQGAIKWLIDSGIVNICYNLKNLELPLEGNKSLNEFKLYMRDTGLLFSLLDTDSDTEIMKNNLGIYKGAIYENIIADILTKNNIKLYYFEKNSSIELDFITKYNNKLTCIEVKSADNTKSRSMISALNNYGVEQGIKLSTKNLGFNNKNVINYPIYMAMFIKQK